MKAPLGCLEREVCGSVYGMNFMTRTSGGFYRSHNCTIVGDVKLSEDASVWFGAVIRGDVAPLTIGRRTNIQDNAVVHADTDVPNDIEDEVVVGHSAIVHGRRVGAGSLIGMGAILLSQSVIGKGCLIAAGAVVSPGMVVPDGMVVMGVPGKVVRPVRAKDVEYCLWLRDHYVDLARKFVAGEFKNVE
jgi:carbonic anhydrase/acetyltransferase-like protein (isoleucine patch superfamily)